MFPHAGRRRATLLRRVRGDPDQGGSMRVVRTVTATAALVVALAAGHLGRPPVAQAATPDSLGACTKITAYTANDRLTQGLYTLTVYSASVQLTQYVRMFGSQGDRY